MISRALIQSIVKGYDVKKITIGVLGGHSALDVCHGAKKHGFRTVAVCQKGREKTYTQYYKTRTENGKTVGCIDEVILVDHFKNIVKPEVQKKLRDLFTIFIHNRYFWVYCNFAEIENTSEVPIFGTREMVKLEERGEPHNQYYFLEKAGIRMPKFFKNPAEIDRLVIVKVAEATRSYERGFFLATSQKEYNEKSQELIKKSLIKETDLSKAVIEEYIVGAPVNFNFFYSPLTKTLELLGTDTRRQTDLEGFLRMPASVQMEVLAIRQPRFIETGHIAVTVKESLLEKIFDLGERFVATTQKEVPPGIIGPFALQGAVTAEQGKEDIVIFDVSMRIPGSPGTRGTPYSGYLYGETLSYGERIAMEIRRAITEKRLAEVVT